MYQRILVPLDGSSTAEAVLPYARALAQSWRIPVELLHAIESDPKRFEQASQASQQYLKGVAATFTDAASLETLDKPGKPAEVIVSEAAEKQDSLIAMSTHGRTGIGRWVMGSVADRVLQATDSSLLLVRGEGDSPSKDAAHFDCVILPLDGSALAEAAFESATGLAKGLALPLMIVRVVAPMVSYYPAGAGGLTGLDEVLEGEEENARAYLEKMVRQASAQGVDQVTSSLLRGFPASELMDLAQEHPHSITVMSTHGRSGLGRWVMGSVTDRVARHTGQPVLVIRSSA